MSRFLVFTLSATIASMGELAGHERRGSLSWPGRSAVLGIVGAALGIRRDGDFSALDRLSLAVAVFDSGHVMRDFHTVQTVPSAAVKAPNSRTEALIAARGRLNTTITKRDYRCGVLYGVALAGESLELLRDALLAPQFTLYLGRKSCPLSAPLCPRLVDAPTPEKALQSVQLPQWQASAHADLLLTEANENDDRVEVFHDAPLDRRRWHFAPRKVALRTVDIRPGGTAP